MAFFNINGSTIERKETANFQVPERETEQHNNGIPANAFGTPVYDNLYFDAGNYIDQDGNNIAFNGLHINSVLLTVNMTKQIVKTAIQGRNGTVKEYISDGDYVISATGTITGNGIVYPENDVADFVALTKVPQQLRVTSAYLNDSFNVYWLVIESVTVSQKTGMRNEVAFSMTAVSDFVADLEEITQDA